MTFADKVKYVRTQLNLSQEKLAVLLEVSFATVNRWEKGRAMPSYVAQERFNVLCRENEITFEGENK